MATSHPPHFANIAQHLLPRLKPGVVAALACPGCGMPNLTPEELAVHIPLYHNEGFDKPTMCALCDDKFHPLIVHLVEHHSLAGGNIHRVKQNVFSLVIVRRPTDGKYLMVDEVMPLQSTPIWSPRNVCTDFFLFAFAKKKKRAHAKGGGSRGGGSRWARIRWTQRNENALKKPVCR
jgi:hypothetical protein